jgi:hypothetical protein
MEDKIDVSGSGAMASFPEKCLRQKAAEKFCCIEKEINIFGTDIPACQIKFLNLLIPYFSAGTP